VASVTAAFAASHMLSPLMGSASITIRSWIASRMLRICAARWSISSRAVVPFHSSPTTWGYHIRQLDAQLAYHLVPPDWPLTVSTYLCLMARPETYADEVVMQAAADVSMASASRALLESLDLQLQDSDDYSSCGLWIIVVVTKWLAYCNSSSLRTQGGFYAFLVAALESDGVTSLTGQTRKNLRQAAASNQSFIQKQRG
jgi:hypothetical protein